MNRRPLSVTVVGCIFTAAGAIGLAYHASELMTQGLFEAASLWVCMLRLLAILGGVFVLRGHNWARWLLVAWMAYHVILSYFHTVPELAAHVLLFAGVTYAVFRRPAGACEDISRRG